MKKFVLFALLLGLGGCKHNGRNHEIVCTDPFNENVIKEHITTPGNVVAIVVKGQAVLAYYNDDYKTELIKLDQNDCVIY